MAFINFNQAPYYDDYDQKKGFLKILYKPSYAVQARELTQMQDILQAQIGALGGFTFQSGSPVLGGQLTFDHSVTYANVNPLYQNTSVNITQFANSVITDAATRKIRASVVATLPQLAGSSNPPTLMIKYLTGSTFANGANVTLESSNSGPFALLANTNSQGSGSMVNINDGIFYLNLTNLDPTPNANANTVTTTFNSFFVYVPQQSLVLDPYDSTPSYRIGLQISDKIVSVQTDTSLYDPALGSSNFQAPGADRYVVDAILSSRLLTSTDDSQFLEMTRIINGQLQSVINVPLLSDLNKVLATRTHDTSGDFTVTPYTIRLTDTANNDLANANSQQYYALLDPGLAYVQGYRYQTVVKTALGSPRARTTANVSNYNLQTYFGNYVLVDTVRGEFNFTTLPTLDMHCVNWSNVNTASVQAYANTLIGQVKLRSFEYNSASNTSNGLTYVFRAGLFDVNTASITGNTVGSNANNITFASLFNAADNAYFGMVINIPATGDQRIITQYNGANRLATVNPNWSSNPSPGGNFIILGSTNALESIGANGSTNYATSNANINIGSKVPTSPFLNVAFTDTSFVPLLFPFPNQFIANNSISGQQYEYRYRVATNQTLTPGVGTVVNLSIPGDSSATFAAAGIANSDLITLSDFLLVQPSGGNTIPMISTLGRSVVTTTTTSTFTTSGSDPTFTGVDIYASIKSTVGPKTKTFVTGNTTYQTSGGTTVGQATVFLSQGQVQFANPLLTNLTTPGVGQDIYISDVVSVIVVDSGLSSTAVTTAMLQAAANGSSMPGSSVNMTNNYTLNTGQNDSYYDHATLTLNPGAVAPKGQVAIVVNYYSWSSTGAYCTAASYPNYTTIPVYSSYATATTYNLRDVIDFRPRRDDATTAYTFANNGAILLPEPIPGQDFLVSFAYYLPRIDKIILTKNGQFQVIQGSASLSPQPPKTPNKSMLLYTLNVPAYTLYSTNVTPQMYDNKRYTMKDIGKLDKRLRTVEYYTVLNAQEKNAAGQTINDASGNQRPYNSILVDAFQDFSVADVLNPSFLAAIDTSTGTLRPPFISNGVPLSFSPSLSSSYQQNGHIITLPYTTAILINQPICSRIENLNPFNLTSWIGTLKLDPESDTWIQTQSVPALVINNVGSNDAYAAAVALQNAGLAYQTVWNNWQTIWTGTSSSTSTTGAIYSGYNTMYDYYGQYGVQSTTTETVENQARSGVQTNITPDTITTFAGTLVIDKSVIPYMRANKISFVASGMKPLTTMYPFFDNVPVTPYVAEAGIITFTSNVAWQTTYEDTDVLTDTDGGTNGGHGANSAKLLFSKDNIAYVGDVIGVIYPGKTLQGSRSGATGVVASFVATSGYTGEPAGQRYQSVPFTAGVTSMANANSIVLQGCSANTDGYYVGNTIYISTGEGLGQSSNITAYNGASRIATVSPNFNFTLAAPTTEMFYYQIGSLNTDGNGDICGQFLLPSTSTIEFATGTSTFLLTDTPLGNVSFADTKAQDNYTAQGTLETTQQEFVTTRVPVFTTQSVSQSQTLVSDSVTTQQVFAPGGGDITAPVASQELATSGPGSDPLAQTFYIDNNVHPDGIFLTSVRLCFYSKDNFVPITMQLRPVVNGYPDAGTIIPFSEVTMRPNQINVATAAPSLDTPGQYTEFFFDAPVYLSPGQQYAMVLLTTTNNYNIFTAKVGDMQLGSNRLISTPPYIGVLFLSQNASTWTAAQGESMMFRMYQAQFNTSNPMVATFGSKSFESNKAFNLVANNEVYMDYMYLTNQDMILPDTTLGYAYRSTDNVTRSLDATYSSVTPAQNFTFPSRKVLVPTGNSLFVQATGTSVNPDISPVIDSERYSTIAISNYISGGGFTNNNITIVNPGLGYNLANTNIVNVTGGGGSGAQLSLFGTNGGGSITSLIVNPNGSGTNYSGNAIVSVLGSGYNATINATVQLSVETNPSGGNFFARYMTRMVTLATGMDAGDLNVIINANKPVGSQIFVYYKILSGSDTTPFIQRPWVQMSLQGVDNFATSPTTYYTYQYVGNLDQYGNPIRRVNYGNYNTFKYYAVKIVMETNNSTNVPLIQNLRVYAMPATT